MSIAGVNREIKKQRKREIEEEIEDTENTQNRKYFYIRICYSLKCYQLFYPGLFILHHLLFTFDNTTSFFAGIHMSYKDKDWIS